MNFIWQDLLTVKERVLQQKMTKMKPSGNCSFTSFPGNFDLAHFEGIFYINESQITSGAWWNFYVNSRLMWMTIPQRLMTCDTSRCLIWEICSAVLRSCGWRLRGHCASKHKGLKFNSDMDRLQARVDQKIRNLDHRFLEIWGHGGWMAHFSEKPVVW